MKHSSSEWRQYGGIAILATAFFVLSACSKSPPAASTASENQPANTAQLRLGAPTATDAGLASLFSHVWRVSKSPSPPPPGSIYIFLASGTLLETSCVETYRVATWTIEKNSPRQLKVMEDRQLAFLANIEELTDRTLRLKKELVRSKESQDVTLEAVEGEFVCPDLPK